MTLREFIAKHKVDIDQQFLDIAVDGLERMKKSGLSDHNEKHIYDIFGDLEEMIERVGMEKFENIDWNVFLPALCWHDAWKATRKTTKNLLLFKWEQLWDGKGSQLLFRKYLRKKRIRGLKATKISDTIYFHAPIRQFFWRKKERWAWSEGKLLRDLDGLQIWNMKRYLRMKQEHINEDYTFKNPRYLKLGKWIYKKFMKSHEDKYLFYAWTREVFDIRKHAVLKEAEKL